MNAKSYILERLDIAAFYSAVFVDYTPGNNVHCPFAAKRHQGRSDNNPSMSLNEDGKIFCHSCAYKATSPIALVEDMRNISFKAACEYVYNKFIESTIPLSEIRKREKNLQNNPLAIVRLKAKRKILKKTLEKYRIGWDGRLTFPIFNCLGYCVDVRRYDLYGKYEGKGIKVVSWKKGFGGARLWPIETMKQKDIFIFEGETDTLLALQEGLPAITVTSGARTWPDEFAKQFSGKRVLIVPDIDKAGQAGAEKRASAIAAYADTVKIIPLPGLTGGKGDKDFTDWVMKHDGSGNKLKELSGTKGVEIAAPVKNEAGLEVFDDLSKSEQINIARADAALGYMHSHGAFFKNQDGELFYVENGGQAFRLDSHGEKFLSYLSNNISSLINSSTSSGRFVIQHILTRAHASCKSSISASWCTYYKSAIYLSAKTDQLLKCTNRKAQIIRNAVNDDGVLLESPSGNRAFTPDVDIKPRVALDLFWDLVICNIPVSKANRFKVAAWLLGIFFKEYIRPKPLLRFEARTASGKSTASKLISMFIYGDELLQHAATTSAATYVMAKQYPLLLFDNIEARNMTPDFQDFLLIAATGGMKSKRQLSTDTGIVQESARCLVLTNGIEPISRHELITRTLEVRLDLNRFGLKNFNETKILHKLGKNRGKILSGISKLLAGSVIPRIKNGDIPKIMRRFPPHSKERFNEYMALMAIILDAIWPYRRVPGYGIPHNLITEWLESDTTGQGEQMEGTNEVLYFLNTFAKRWERILDLETACWADKNVVIIKGTTRAMLSDWRVMAKQLGIKCPWQNERQLGTRIADASNILRKAGWKRIKKLSAGRTIYEYTCKKEKIQ